MTAKAIGFDRKLPEPGDYDTMDYPATNTLPIGLPDGSRHGAR